ncbi:response regulator transcription factor [Facklamia miroungae]|uniref:DNA-binding response regulator, NarL/FixJ family, contains REC and HTH domains n=1 Tax=Facklamia miroungae TaxID=120956 RepID=A0A1G7RUG4_9LACT|nr:response regulator transcription factor [Facklamia miroungae]NKZ29301.1 response regulator transcription factor [Facklamia miroungae]SDG13490.1 DNA-binding response regulator, NarL/FixJ family, contains REC and HTH domains [Facklamia miroungae]
MKILLVDDERLIRSGLAILLEEFEDVDIVGQAGNGQEAYDFIKDHEVDVVLMDIRMPEVNGIEGTRLILAEKPHVKVLILTTFQDTEYIDEAMRLGASGYLLKDSSHKDIYEGLKLAMADKIVLDKVVSKQFMSNSVAKLSPQDYDLNDKELEIITWIARGLNNAEIAEKMFLSKGTVKNNVSYILNKLALRDRTQLAIFAFEKGLVDSQF